MVLLVQQALTLTWRTMSMPINRFCYEEYA